MATDTENPYANHRIDDWNWEFLKRNSRYKRLYKIVQRLKACLDKKGFAPVASLTVFGMPFRFERVDRGNGTEWSYQGKLKHPIYLNDFSSPDNPSSRRYKGKLIKKLRAITRIDDSVDTHGNGRTPALLQEHEIAVQIDTRFSSQQIVSSLKNILATIQPKTKIHDKKYKYYLAVWDLSQQDKTQKEIAEIVWPDEYKANAKAVSDYTTGEKGYLIQRVSDHQKRAQKLIEASIRTVFPPKKRSPKSRNKP